MWRAIRNRKPRSLALARAHVGGRTAHQKRKGPGDACGVAGALLFS
jgi:hypothetical protein